jgi:mannose-6-phosphate isomerase-like protein (cupin superfamily)
MLPPLTVVALAQQAQGIDTYQNLPLTLVNDHVVRLSVMIDAYPWHYHPNSDETFLTVEGVLCIDLDERTVELAPGQLLTIPAGVRHRTRPLGSRSVNLTFELAGMQTVQG